MLRRRIYGSTGHPSRPCPTARWPSVRYAHGPSYFRLKVNPLLPSVEKHDNERVNSAQGSATSLGFGLDEQVSSRFSFRRTGSAKYLEQSAQRSTPSAQGHPASSGHSAARQQRSANINFISHQPPIPKHFEKVQDVARQVEQTSALSERLFPIQAQPLDQPEYGVEHKQSELPPLVELAVVEEPPASTQEDDDRAPRVRQRVVHYPNIDLNNGPSPVLRVEAVSTQLTITDFRRIIPQGKHIEGWTLDRGDILNVIPGRELDLLTARQWYLLVFASPESARAYYDHAQAVHKIARNYTPDPARLSTQILPEGIKVDGMDAAQVVQAYTIVAPGRRLYMNHLKYPFSPFLKLFLQDAGLPWMKHRPDRHDYELLLTLDGPDVSTRLLKKIFRRSGEHRALSWSGGQSYDVDVVRWNPVRNSAGQVVANVDEDESPPTSKPDQSVIERQPTFIIGFETEHAARSFRAYWHNRPLFEDDPDKFMSKLDDHPPTLQLEPLW